jgi:hypothetical protein
MNRPSMACRVLITVSACLIAGCAGYTPTVKMDEKPTAKDTYLYGRFYMVNPPRNAFTGNPQTMGFAFKCADENVYIIRFEPNNEVQAIKIAPSTCSLTELVFTDSGGLEAAWRKPVPDALKREVVFEPGKAYYLGDFRAETTQSGVPGLAIARTWRLKSARNDYARTTAQMKIGYPNLSTVPTEDRMIYRREQASP